MRIFLALVLLATSAGNIVAGQAGHADQLVQQLGRGINVLGYDPIWKDPSKAHFQPGDDKMLHASGFQHIRVNLQAFTHMDAADKLDPKWLETLDSVIEHATEAGLLVILDEHDFQFCGRDVDECRTKLLAFWRQIAPRYRNAPASVLFEILNEPNRAMTPDLWNGLLSETLALIRQTNPTRGVVIGPANSNNFHSLDALVLPTTDRNIIVTVHYYDPFPFTHQGATWTVPSRERLIGVPWGTDADHQTIVRNFRPSLPGRKPMIVPSSLANSAATTRPIWRLGLPGLRLWLERRKATTSHGRIGSSRAVSAPTISLIGTG